MPYKVKKSSGSKPYKIVRKDTGKTVGSSKTKTMAQASIRARYMHESNRRTGQ